MRRVWLVAQREFLAAVMNKGFVIGLLVMPAIVALLITLMPRLMSTQGTQIRGEVAVIDPTGQILESLREGLSPEVISRRRAEGARRALENTPAPVREVASSSSDAAIARAMGAVPALTIVERPATADVQSEKRWLTETVPAGGAEASGAGRLCIPTPSRRVLDTPSTAPTTSTYPRTRMSASRRPSSMRCAKRS